MVDQAVIDPQWLTITHHAMGFEDRFRCIHYRMGSQLLGEKCRWTVVPGEGNLSYQLLEAKSGLLST